MSRPGSGDALFDTPATRGVGPVYQGVCAQIRHLFPKGDDAAEDRKRTLAGTIAQARSLAASIDRDSGHAGGKQANGVPLATMHGQLDALLERLAGTGATDPFMDLLNELNEGGASGASRAETPHAAQ